MSILKISGLVLSGLLLIGSYASSIIADKRQEEIIEDKVNKLLEERKDK